jgi:uncharacterized protein YkwD
MIVMLVVGMLLTVLAVVAGFSLAFLGWPRPTHPVAAQPTTRVAPTSPASATSRPAAPAIVTPSITASSASPNRLELMEDQIIAHTNAERAKSPGCPSLRLDDRLRTAAQRHAADMASYGYLSHTGHDRSTPVQRMQDAGYDASGLGWAENVARGYPTVTAVMAGWMNSAGHRANILNCSFKAIGVGVARAADGELYFTQDFGGR